MLRRVYGVALAALFVFGCGKGGLDDAQTLIAYKAAGNQKAPESQEGKELVEKIVQTEEAARKVVEQEPVPALPVSTIFYADNEAFEEAGYHPSALTLTLERSRVAGRAHVLMKSHDEVPEEAEVFDDMGQPVAIITYLWDRDKDKADSPPHILGAVKKSSDQRMLGLYYYCTRSGQLYVHDLNSFRVHAAFARRVSIDKSDIKIEFIAPKNAKRPAWPTCQDLTAWHDGPDVESYQTAYGIHRLHFSFDETGNPVLVEYMDKNGKPAENLRGIFKRQMFWDNGRLSGQAWYSAAGLLSRYTYEYDSKGNILRRRVLDAQGQPGLDFFGVYTYDYDRDNRDRVVRETRRDKNNDVIEIYEFTYALYSQIKTHTTKDGQGNIKVTQIHEYNNKGLQLLYSPHTHRCCQHNVAMTWPWYVQNLWQATADNGLAAWLYAESDVTAKVGRQGKEVTIRARTDYPFKGTVDMTVAADEPVKFPLYLRVPRWCRGFSVAVNGRKLHVEAQPQMYVRIERLWSKGDRLNIEMPMEISLTEWPRTGSVTVDRGPLSYSVRIEERWKRYGTNQDWPEWEVFPDSPWNYGLLIDRDNPAKSLEVTVRDGVSEQPWTLKNAPVEIRANAKRIAEWGLENNTVQELQPSPVESDEPEETITMIPLGCARLRMSCLPTISSDRKDNHL